MTDYDKEKAKRRDILEARIKPPQEDNLQVYVYVKPAGHCANCDWVKEQFNHAGVDFKEEIINEDILEYAQERGFSSAPIVIAFPKDRPKIEFSGKSGDGVDAVISAAQLERALAVGGE